MNIKRFFAFVIILGIIAGIYIFLYSPQKTEKKSETANLSSGLVVGKNSIYVADQAPGRSILVSVVNFEKPGFVVIHEDDNGVLGKIIGASRLLLSGEAKNLDPISLERETRDGETIYAMIHLDNGDGKFDSTVDKPAIDSEANEPVMMIVTISKDAQEPSDVSL